MNYDKENDFQKASDEIQNKIFELPKNNFLELINEIGIIPEAIGHDSKEEKLFSKVSEIFLARCFLEIGLKSTLYITRGNCADVLAESRFHNYSLVADAKSFRLSRTAKNQKDFKVESLNVWKRNNDYAILCCPYFQYPQKKSAIYKQAIDYNVTLFSWEYFRFLIENNIRENIDINLSSLWNFGIIRAKNISCDKAELCFLGDQNEFLVKQTNLSKQKFDEIFNKFKFETFSRGQSEIQYWENKIIEVKNYSREEAINSLLKSLKLNEKINTIQNFIKDLKP
ncbi:MAG: HindIII family type II restriction endonuclease [Selenomonadaceae bacterium]|nr:HindIII family type II restriction endonuclease [Selenomonadaceae bacterium]